MSLWPFHSGGRIQDLKAPELAEAARQSIQKAGRTAYAMRLIYRALEVDPYNPYALLVLSEVFRGKTKGARPTGDEVFAGLVLEYAVDRKSTVTPDQKRHFDKARLEIMAQWGFVISHGTESEADHIGYMTYINELMSVLHSVSNGFKLAVTKIGQHAGIWDTTKNAPNRAYREWLQSDAKTLHN